MADNSAIEWTDATWNPIRGCTRVSPGCGGPGPHGGCYAEGIAARFSGPGQAYEGLAEMRGHKPRWTGKVAFVEDALTLPLRWRKPRRIFVNSMSDLFHEKVEDGWIDRIFAVMALAPQHTFQVLTKRADRMRAYLSGEWQSRALGVIQDMDDAGTIHPDRVPILLPPVLGHVWLGVSVEDQRRADERIPDLLATPAAVRWISAEPLLGPVDLNRICLGRKPGVVLGEGGAPDRPETFVVYRDALLDTHGDFERLDWVVVGGESGPGARPMHPDWARSLRDQCAAAGVPYLFKQQGAWAEVAEHPRGRFVSSEPDAEAIQSRSPAFMAPIGKKAAGRLLDGIEHNGFPESGRAGAEGSRRG